MHGLDVAGRGQLGECPREQVVAGGRRPLAPVAVPDRRRGRGEAARRRARRRAPASPCAPARRRSRRGTSSARPRCRRAARTATPAAAAGACRRRASVCSAGIGHRPRPRGHGRLRAAARPAPRNAGARLATRLTPAPSPRAGRPRPASAAKPTASRPAARMIPASSRPAGSGGRSRAGSGRPRHRARHQRPSSGTPWSVQTRENGLTHRPRRRAHLEADDAAAGPHHPRHLGEPAARGRPGCARRSRRVAAAKLAVLERQRQGVALAPTRRAALFAPGDLQHLRREVEADHAAARPHRAPQLDRQVAGAAADVERGVARARPPPPAPPAAASGRPCPPDMSGSCGRSWARCGRTSRARRSGRSVTAQAPRTRPSAGAG